MLSRSSLAVLLALTAGAAIILSNTVADGTDAGGVLFLVFVLGILGLLAIGGRALADRRRRSPS